MGNVAVLAVVPFLLAQLRYQGSLAMIRKGRIHMGAAMLCRTELVGGVVKARIGDAVMNRFQMKAFCSGPINGLHGKLVSQVQTLPSLNGDRECGTQ